MTRVIGLTGGIACGKSLVAGFLRELGVPVIDADHVAREVVEPPSSALERIEEAFGSQVLLPDGSLDREEMAALIFGDPVARANIESILHPEIEQAVAVQVARHEELGTATLVYEAALLVETGIAPRLDGLIVVVASPEQQMERLLSRQGLSRQEALQRIESQLPLSEKSRLADEVVDNSGSREETRSATRRAWHRLCESFGRGAGGSKESPE